MNDNKTDNQSRSIIFARGVANDGENSINDQIERAHQFCHSEGIKVVGSVRLHGLSANDRATEEALETLLNRKARESDYDVLITSDLSRLTRKGVCHAMAVLSRFEKAGIRIITLDGGEVAVAVFGSTQVNASNKNFLGHPYGKEKTSCHSVRLPPHDERGEAELQDGGYALDEGKGKPRTGTQEGN